ncbi:MAG: DUF4389 domain-containing protein [Alphaproteobacteria bacterium]|nr:DUF4389 domain-containing protein [Alphaproteobacteria bacterium]
MNNLLDDNQLKEHVKDKDTWLRFIYLVVFGIAFYLSIMLTFATSLFQFLSKLFSGSTFGGLSDFGDCLASYQAQVTRFLTFSADDKPFPFAPFPEKKTKDIAE